MDPLLHPTVAMRIAAFVVALVAGAASVANQTKPANVQVIGHVLEPAKLPPTEDTTARLQVPSGFRVSRFADGLGKPRMLAVSPAGHVYVTRRETGDVLLLHDADGDGRADVRHVVARRPQVHGIALSDSRAYLATVKEVFVADIASDGRFGEPRRIIDDLPDGGQHPNRTLAIGPDGMLYVSVGSTCNACPETNPEHATLLRARPDGRSRTIFASGLRNTIGFGWHPETRELWGMDHGIDWLGDDEQKEELNLLVDGEQYGWPYIYADSRHNPQPEPPGELSMEEWAKMSRPPVLLYTAHSAPMQLAFYGGAQFPPEYRGDAFVAMRGSWNRKPPSGYEVVRIRFEQGKPVAFEPFATGFLVEQDGGWAFIGRPTGVAVAADGALLVSDDTNGVVYRIAYGGTGKDGE
jgi:glucose/arabinose dehydrogenase